MVILETPRLILRRFTEADAPVVLELNSDPQVLKYLHEPQLKDEAHAIEILRNIIFPQYKYNLGRWAVIVKDTDEFIGWCGLKYILETHKIDLGYRFKPSAWGKGYATEAARHTLQYGLDVLKLPEITASAHVENIGSVKVLENIGMQFTGEGIVDECPVKMFVALP
jgi:RimJ/RimL family protein N-acetyltransferase